MMAMIMYLGSPTLLPWSVAFDNITIEWPGDVQELVSEMAQIRNDCALPIILLASQDPAHVRYIQGFLNDMDAEPPGWLLWNFRDESDRPITEWNDMEEASYRNVDLPLSPIKYCFPSLEVAAICTRRFLEHRFQESVMRGLSGGTDVTFVIVVVRLVIAFIRYLDRQ
jgi:hypothetical protein